MTLTINWRTIVAAVASGLVGWLIRHLLDYFSLFEKLTVAAKSPQAGKLFKALFTAQYSLFDILVIILLAVGVYRFGSWLMRKFFGNEARLTKARQEIMRFNNMPLGKQNLLCKWRVEFDEWGQPKVEDLQPYCTAHGIPPVPMKGDLLSNRYNCLGCSNHVPDVTVPRLYIQGQLESHWEKLVGTR
jgi:hypothetical protein